jgi:hypothetical protein
MTTISRQHLLAEGSRTSALSGTKVCMHVLKSAQADVRGMRTYFR